MKTHCQHTHNISGKNQTCRVHTYLGDLPLDTNQLCIFHSPDYDWKRANKGFDWLIKLFTHIYKSKPTTFGFHGFHFVGTEFVEEYFTKEAVIYFKRQFFRADLSFFDCHFLDEMEIEDSVFGGTLSFLNCTFHEEITFNGCRFFEEVNFYDHCTFQRKIAFYNFNDLRSKLEFVHSTFAEDLDLDGTVMQGSLYIDLCKFNLDHGLYLLSNTFYRGVSIRNNTGIGLLSIQENVFQDDSLIHNINNDGSIEITSNRFHGEVKFQGTANNLFFNPNTVIEIETDDFSSERARLVFDYCNMLSLNEKLLHQLGEWEEEERVLLNDSNKMTRFKYVHLVDNTDITEDLLQDIFTLVVRYFNHRYNTILTVDFRRLITEPKVKIIFSSKQLIDFNEFFAKYVKCIQRIFTRRHTTPATDYNDLEEQIFSINRRVRGAIRAKQFDLADLKMALNLDEQNVNLNFYIENNMSDNYHISNSNIGAVGTNAASHNNSFQNLNIGNNQFDYTTLSEQFGTLLQRMNQTATTETEQQEIQAVTAAKTAIDEKDEKSLLEKLKGARKFALETAKDIGVEVAAEVIKGSMGM